MLKHNHCTTVTEFLSQFLENGISSQFLFLTPCSHWQFLAAAVCPSTGFVDPRGDLLELRLSPLRRPASESASDSPHHLSALVMLPARSEVHLYSYGAF